MFTDNRGRDINDWDLINEAFSFVVFCHENCKADKLERQSEVLYSKRAIWCQICANNKGKVVDILKYSIRDLKIPDCVRMWIKNIRNIQFSDLNWLWPQGNSSAKKILCSLQTWEETKVLSSIIQQISLTPVTMTNPSFSELIYLELHDS